MKIPNLQVTVKSPEKIYFQGEATAVSSINKEGPFDVLSYHTNFISIIKETLVIHQLNNVPITIPIDAGIMKVWENTVHIFLGITPS